MLRKSNTTKSFTYDYGNYKGIKIKDVIKIFSYILKKKCNRSFIAIFKNPYPNKNIISNNKLVYSYDSKENSKKILADYYNSLINEKTKKLYYL